MLTRLKVTGFKNLVDVDVSFGPFTCIAGANGSGKSNLFDAIMFLSNTTRGTLIEAASKVRNEEGRGQDIRNLFYRRGDIFNDVIKYYVEMIIPSEGMDDLGQKAKASATVVRYRLELKYKLDDNSPLLGSFEILRESLRPIKKINLGFQHNLKWRKSVIKTEGPNCPASYISTPKSAGKRFLILHLDIKKKGRRKKFLAENMPSTVLSTVDALENPTASLCRREMQSWKVLQLEPSSLRKPDRFSDPPHLGADGSHLAAYLYRLARTDQKASRGRRPKTWVFDQITSRLDDLITDLHEIHVDRNEITQLLTVMATDRQGTVHPAHSLSDGTLRFLALAALEQDPLAGGVFCLEEPENGINPKRIVSMIMLLEGIAMDAEWPVDKDNPLRQIIINTHSPLVVANVRHDSLLIAKVREKIVEGRRLKSADFRWLPDTWREKIFPDIHALAKGEIIEYLNHIIISDNDFGPGSSGPSAKSSRVAARPDLAPYLPFITDADD